MTTNLLIYYLIVKVNYAKLFLITMLIFISIEFEIFKKVSCTYNGLVKSQKKIKPS